MTRFFSMAFAAAALTAAMPAQAADFIFDTTTAGDNFRYTATAGGETLRMNVSAYNRNFGDTISAATLQSFTHGLGIVQAVEGGNGAYHQIDNVNGWEFLVLRFDRPVTLLGSQVNAFQLSDRGYIDADQFVGWGTTTALGGGTALPGWNTVLNGLAGRDNVSSDPVFNAGQNYATVKTNFNLTNASGDVWLLGAAIGDAARDPDGRNDAFKLAQVTARSVAAVPEPATWATMLVGFGMVGAASRYRRRRTGAAIA